MLKLAIFDLDGTLLNTIEDLGNACNHALKMCGYPERKPEEYNFLVGRGIYNLFRGALPERERSEENIMKMKSFFISFLCVSSRRPHRDTLLILRLKVEDWAHGRYPSRSLTFILRVKRIMPFFSCRRPSSGNATTCRQHTANITYIFRCFDFNACIFIEKQPTFVFT